MENINLIDAVSLLIIFISAMLAYFRGLSREILAIASWIAAAVIAFIIAPLINPLINQIPIVKEILTDSCQLSILISFVISFILSLIFLSLLIPMLTNFIHQSSLNGLDRLLGLCFGTLRGLLIIIALTIGYELLFTNEQTLMDIDKSRTMEIIYNIKDEFKTLVPDSKPEWITHHFDTLMATCDKPVTQTENTLNLK